MRGGPRYLARSLQVVTSHGRPLGPDRWFVLDVEAGRNVTAELLDPLLPEGAPWAGARYVSGRQALILAEIGNAPADLAATLRAEVTERLRAGHRRAG